MGLQVNFSNRVALLLMALYANSWVWFSHRTKSVLCLKRPGPMISHTIPNHSIKKESNFIQHRTDRFFYWSWSMLLLTTSTQLLLFMNKLLGYDKDAELLLRWQLRLLFLDSCSADDQVMWCDIIFHECSAVYAPTVFHQAKLALLLSAPLTFSGREGDFSQRFFKIFLPMGRYFGFFSASGFDSFVFFCLIFTYECENLNLSNLTIF